MVFRNSTTQGTVFSLPEVCPSWDWEGRYGTDLHQAYRVVANHVYRGLGQFAYLAFDHINANYFEGKLPETLILWDLTEYGHSLGWCRSPEDGPPIIKLHPSLVYPSMADKRGLPAELSTVFGYAAALFGWCFAYDVLLHECVHVSEGYLLGGYERLLGVRSYWTCHNNPLWVAELNRIAPLLGYRGDPFTMKLPKRVPVPGEFGKRGKPKTKTVLAQDGDAPDLEHFPHNLPGRDRFYLARQLPFPWEERRKRAAPQTLAQLTQGDGESVSWN